MSLNYTGLAIVDNSDHGSFMGTGALETGAGGLKTDLEAQLFGGVAGVSYDACSHTPCDAIDNISHEALILNARAVARALAILASDISAIEAEQAQAQGSGAKVALAGAAHPMSDLGQHTH
ncbi:hypothetical protein DFH09DRAFT_1315837 [Mycena vulgaris]|nr:hypothetical protein DFH09DRAFT_1315837 [Mycena vulgaris]